MGQLPQEASEVRWPRRRGFCWCGLCTSCGKPWPMSFAPPGEWDRLLPKQRRLLSGGVLSKWKPWLQPNFPCYHLVQNCFPLLGFGACCQGILGLELFAKWIFRIKPLKVAHLPREQNATELRIFGYFCLLVLKGIDFTTGNHLCPGHLSKWRFV